MTLFWMTAKDWLALARYKKKGLIKSSGSTVPQLLREIIIGKILYFSYIIGLPLIFSGMAFGMILAGWAVMHAVTGLTLACIFQPAHVLEDLQFAQAEVGGNMDDDTLSHQLKSTANFGTGSRVFTWLCGGLNHQIEHHLFPNVCHIHFRAFVSALALHARMLWRLGRQESWA